MAYVYLNVALPAANHYAVTTEGLRSASGDPAVPEDVFSRPAFIYIPTYLLPEYAHLIRPQVAFNAMSLHEMPPAAIDYYCRALPRMLDQGVFFEVNTLPGVPNAAIDGRLASGFTNRLEINLPALGFRPRIWSWAPPTIQRLQRSFDTARESLLLDEMFDFDFVFEYPRFDERRVRIQIAKTIDRALGTRTTPPDNELMTGNHLAYIVRRSKGIWE
jgi:hypothetical protein